MKKLFVLLLSVLLCFAMTACSDTKESIAVYNWGDYIDESILDDFEAETGIKVNYEMYASNEDLFVKINSSGDAYDVVFPSDYMVSKMVKADLLYEYDVESLENYKNIADNFKNLAYDPDNKYSVPYLWGTMGIVYNKTMVDAEDVKSLNCLFDEKYKDNILLYDAQRDVMAIGFKKLGYSLNSTDKKEIDEVKELMAEQKKNVRAYVTDNMKVLMLSGEAAIGFTDSGDAFQIIYEGGSDTYGYSIPQEGSNMWVDAMVIPKNAKNKEAAKKFIDYMLREDVAQKNLEYVQYSSPNKTVKNPLEEGDNSWVDFQPTEEEISRLEVYTDIPEDAGYGEAWLFIKTEQ